MIDYYGDWKHGNNDSWSTTEGDYYQMTFSGSAVRVIGVKDVDFATIGISIDGGEETVVSTASDTRTGDYLLYENKSLREGKHILKVRLLSGGSHTLTRLEYLPIQDGIYQ